MPLRVTAKQRRRPSEEPEPLSTRNARNVRTATERQFTQRRSETTFRALLQASAQVFSERGFDEAQTPDIARAAGVSVGTFYRYFSDKRQAFIEMISDRLQTAYEHVMGRMTLESFGGPLPRSRRRDAVERVIDVMFAHAAENPELHRVFIGLSLRDDEVRRIRNDFELRGRRVLAALIEQIVPHARIADPEAAAEVIQIAAQEVSVATAGARGGGKKSEAAARALRSALADMITSYVFGER
jgi:AcrR family transcriptional regulator